MKLLISPLILCVFPSLVLAQNEKLNSETQAISENASTPRKPEERIRQIPVNEAANKTIQLDDGSTVKVREIQPIVLSKPSQPFAAQEIDSSMLERIEEYQVANNHLRVCGISATVYRLEKHRTRSHVEIFGLDGSPSTTFWSSCDFSLLSGISGFTDKMGNSFAFFMAWTVHEEILSEKEFLETAGKSRTANLSELDSNKASYITSHGKPDKENRALIDSLHDFLNQNQEKLRIDQAARQRAAKEREDYIRANPPPAKSLTLNHWRIHKTTPKDQEKGGEP